jgi:hypothetical protein
MEIWSSDVETGKEHVLQSIFMMRHAMISSRSVPEFSGSSECLPVRGIIPGTVGRETDQC